MRVIRSVRYVVEVGMLTVVLWMSMISTSGQVLRWAGVMSAESEIPIFFVLDMLWFWLLVAAYHLAKRIVLPLERFWTRRGW